MKKNILVFFIFLSTRFLTSAQNIYDFDHSFNYAKHLFESDRFEPASKEFERLLFFSPDNDSLLFFLSRSYLHSKQYEKALSLIEPGISPNDRKKYVLYLNILLLSQQYAKAETLMATSENISEDEKKLFYARSFLYSGNLKGYKEINLSGARLSEHEKLLFDDANRFRAKIPAMAVGLSVIPGLGKVYTKNYADAAMSFFTVGVCSFLAWRGFDKKGIESIPGLFYGGLGAGLYLGNFYGAFKAAKNYNIKFRQRIKNEMEEIIVSEN